MRVFLRVQSVFLVGLFLALIGGCGKPGAPLGTVRGTVTFDGAPLAGARVVFRPSEGRTSVGTTDQGGAYELTFTPSRKGALLGEHSVAITWESPDTKDADQRSPTDRSAATVVVPARYNTQTTLSATVKPGENLIDFGLESK